MVRVGCERQIIGSIRVTSSRTARSRRASSAKTAGNSVRSCAIVPGPWYPWGARKRVEDFLPVEAWVEVVGAIEGVGLGGTGDGFSST
jgi:hypothetical protein